MSLAAASASVAVESLTEFRLVLAVDRWMTLRQRAAQIAHLRQSGSFRRLGG